MSLRLPIALVVGTILLLGAGARADAQVQTSGEEQFPGQNEIAVHTGIMYGLSNYGVYGGTPGGWLLTAEYSRQLGSTTSPLWLNLGATLVYGGGSCYGCSFNGNGSLLEPFAGIKFKFKTPIPLVPYGKADGGFLAIFDRYCGDNGFGLGLRAAVGANYFILKNVGIGLETGFEFGPAFYTGENPACGNFDRSHTELFATWDIALGAEFIF